MDKKRERFKNLIRQSVQGYEVSLLIAVCLSAVILVSLSVLRYISDKDGGTRACPADDIIHTLNLIPSTQLGIAEWQIGDYATYRYSPMLKTPLSAITRYFAPPAIKVRLSPRNVKFHIIGELNKSGERRYWMRKSGFEFFREIPNAIYRLVMPNDLRITPESPRFNFVRNYVPEHSLDCHQMSTPLATLVKQDEVTLELSAGRFDCIHYRVEFGQNSIPIEIWASPQISPLGIVRVSTPSEVLELTSYGQDRDINIPKLIQPVIDGISTLERGCSSCHGSPCHEFIDPPL